MLLLVQVGVYSNSFIAHFFSFYKVVFARFSSLHVFTSKKAAHKHIFT